MKSSFVTVKILLRFVRFKGTKFVRFKGTHSASYVQPSVARSKTGVLSTPRYPLSYRCDSPPLGTNQ
jgi:hypothetical protein